MKMHGNGVNKPLRVGTHHFNGEVRWILNEGLLLRIAQRLFRDVHGGCRFLSRFRRAVNAIIGRRNPNGRLAALVFYV